ncbi:hypothetical protein FHW71_003710 [Enterobacter sp. Sphag1F]|nr:hypothetical protein [Enterobacter sp. Sphag1F]NYI15554.1 hypothetical protein [Enterobacter sp. Sphag71]
MILFPVRDLNIPYIINLVLNVGCDELNIDFIMDEVRKVNKF